MIQSAKENNHIETAVVILGGGLVGALLANALKQQNIPFILIDPLTPQQMIDAVVDGRTTAISLGSAQIFKKWHVWPDCLEHNVQRIDSIRVVEQESISVLDFDASDMGDQPMGYIVKNQYIREALLYSLTHDNRCFFNTSVQHIEKNAQNVVVTLSNNTVIQASLLVSAEGKNSPSRDLIAPRKKTKDYAQKALVVHLEHDQPHMNRAWEIFTPDGPFAMLPLKDDQQKKSGVVFAKHATFDWNSLNDEQLAVEIQKIFPYYGNVSVVSKRWSFPLIVFELNTIIGHRQVLIGDSAHSMHPLAGQGVNLGWRDADNLATHIIKLYKLGIDIGQNIYLEQYENMRKKDTKGMLFMTDVLNDLFQHPSKTLYYMRNAGLSILNQIKPLKKILMKKAMGL